MRLNNLCARRKKEKGEFLKRKNELDKICKLDINVAKQRLQKLYVVDALMDMLSQHCDYCSKSNTYYDAGLSSNEHGFNVLCQMGLAKGKNNCYKLKYKDLHKSIKKLERCIKNLEKKYN